MQELFVRTDKKLIPTLPRYTFGGRIIVVQSESEANRAVAYLRTQKIVGIDTETRPSFRQGQQHKVALIQIATPDLLEDAQIAKVGLSLKDDTHQLTQRHPGFTPEHFIDLQQMASQMGIEDMSLAKLFANFFRQRISKNAQLSNWEADALDEKQRIYAATDASACLLLYAKMQELTSNQQYKLISVS